MFHLIGISVFFTALLHFPAAVETQMLFVAVEVGDAVTLPCENVLRNQNKCGRTAWLFNRSRSTPSQELFQSGKIQREGLNVSDSCSLIIEKVTEEDGGLYICQQDTFRRQPIAEACVFLSVVTMTEHIDRDNNVTLICSVSTFEPFTYTASWLYDGKDVGGCVPAMMSLIFSCNAAVTFLKFHYMYKWRHTSLQCEVTVQNKMQRFAFRLHSVEKADIYTTRETTPEISSTTVPLSTAWWRFILVCLALSALVITAGTVGIWARITERTNQRNENLVADDPIADDTVVYEIMRPAVETIPLHLPPSASSNQQHNSPCSTAAV